MAEPNPPSRERQRREAQIANDNATIFTRIRAFLRAPPTINSLLLMNVISKLFMVTAVAFIWARSRPLGSFGRNVLAWLTVGDIGITQLLWGFNDLDSWRFDPPQNDVAIQTDPESIKMTRVVVQRDAASSLPSLELVGVRSLRAIEERNRCPKVAVQSDAVPALPSFEFETARPRPVEDRNLHPRVNEESGVDKAIQRVSFTLPVVDSKAIMTPQDAKEEVDVPPSLPSVESETTATPPDTEESTDVASVPSLTSDTTTTIPEVAEGQDSALEPPLKSGTATTLPKVEKEKGSASLLSTKLDTVVTEQEVEAESPRAGSNGRTAWNKIKDWRKRNDRTRNNDRINGNGWNNGNGWSNGNGWNNGNDSGQSDSSPDWDIAKANRHLIKDDAFVDSSDE